MEMTIYDYSISKSNGSELSLMDLKGKVILIVNTAIKWNFTKFLISKTGDVIDRFEPTANIQEIENKILAEL